MLWTSGVNRQFIFQNDRYDENWPKAWKKKVGVRVRGADGGGADGGGEEGIPEPSGALDSSRTH